ncbi:MAG: ABC transporter ATP-binding protein, partial [Rubrobacter sp.]|nr:ABC transporter ATP-binding protein [Rubrobacter sp.]
LTVLSGEFVALLGPSGCGKSTLLRLVAGLERPTAGEICMDGRPVTAPGPDRGMVFQEYALLPWMTVLDNVLFALDCNPEGRSKKERRDVALQYLEMVCLSDNADGRPSELSGGMKQRVGLARTLALNPKVLLMDEPFGALDALTRSVLQAELLGILEESTKTVLLVTHDVDEALLLADRVVVLSRGPEARVEADVTVPFERPRNREEVLASPEYPGMHAKLMDILTRELVA